jgi:hypothetical protein
MSEWQSSYFLDERSKAVHPKNAGLNQSLQTQYIDLDEHDDSLFANFTRAVSSCVGLCCTPKQVLGLLRVLKAITLSFLVLIMLANLMYILFVEIVSSDVVKAAAGGSRDVVLRLYGLGFSLLGIAIELDYTKVVKKFTGLKGFLPRAVLYFFISQIMASRHMAFVGQQTVSNSNSNDDGNAADDAVASSSQYSNSDNTVVDVPTSAIGFQRVTSLVL